MKTKQGRERKETKMLRWHESGEKEGHSHHSLSWGQAWGACSNPLGWGLGALQVLGSVLLIQRFTEWLFVE